MTNKVDEKKSKKVSVEEKDVMRCNVEIDVHHRQKKEIKVHQGPPSILIHNHFKFSIP